MFFKKRKLKKAALKGRCAAVIVAAGSSRRMCGIDKQFAVLSGIPVLAVTLRAFEDSKAISEIIVVVRGNDIERAAGICERFGITKVVKVVPGGPTRLDSVINGVFSVSKDTRIIAIHDGARPCVNAEIIEKTVLAARKYHAAAPAVAVTNTLKKVRNGVITQTVDREMFYEIQTPQVFTSELIKAALTNAKEKGLSVTDDCMTVEAMGVNVHITEGTRENIKLTTRSDLAIAEVIIKNKNTGV